MDDIGSVSDENVHQHLIKQVFGNPLVIDNLLSYLPFKELKNLRLTGRIFRNIWTNKHYLQKALISGFDSEAIKCGTNWKNIRIHLNAGITETEAIKYLLEKHVEFLWLTGNGVHLSEFINKNNEGQRKAVFARLNHLKTNTTTLNGFVIEEFPYLAENLRRVNLHLNVKCARLEEMSLLFRNLSFIAEKCRKLTEFKLTYTNFRNPDVTWKEVQKWRIQTLQANAKTINCMELEATSDVDQLGVTRFPSLKHCTLRGHWTILTAMFLKNQPFLESFQFDCWKGYCPVSTLQTVAEISKSFKKLVVNTNGCNSGANTISSPWRFLSLMKYLESIQILEGGDHFEIYAHLWQNMPASLKSIHMVAVKRIVNGPNISTLSNFPFRDLRELELISGNQIEDVDLQQICSKLSKLEILKFSWCPQCTDYGITGIPTPGMDETNSDISINLLKELKKLTINHCEKITNFIERSIGFQYLTELDLRENKSLESTIPFKEIIWSQNPRLELFHV